MSLGIPKGKKICTFGCVSAATAATAAATARLWTRSSVDSARPGWETTFLSFSGKWRHNENIEGLFRKDKRSLRNILDVDFFVERDPTSSIDEFSWSSICRTFNTSKLFFRTFNTSKLFLRTFNTSKLFFRIFKKCRVLKLQALAWKDKCTQGNNEYAYASGTT
nr:hypothetical protein [Tanacetum cinerariifolium]